MFRKKCFWITVVMLMFLVCSCGEGDEIPEGTLEYKTETQDDTTEGKLYSVETKEVVFSNIYFQSMNTAYVSDNNEFEFKYDDLEFSIGNDETLYAYIVSGSFCNEDKMNYITKNALEKGLMVLEEYPPIEACVVVGTAKQLITMFDNTLPWNKNEKWVLVPAVRPDYRDILKQVGYNGRELIGLGSYLDEIQAIIGAESQSTLSVSVIVPNEE